MYRNASCTPSKSEQSEYYLDDSAIHLNSERRRVINTSAVKYRERKRRSSQSLALQL